MSARFGGRALWSAALLAGLTGCDALLTEPAPAGPEVAVSFQVDASGDGVSRAFSRINRAYLQFIRPDSARRDTLVRVVDVDGVKRVRLRLDTRERVRALGVAAELRFNDKALFKGVRVIRIQIGAPTSAEIPLSPIPAFVRAGERTIRFQHVGDTARLSAAVLFATGDTIPGAPVQWTSANPEVVFVTPAGLAAARQPGETELFVAHGALRDTVLARVAGNR